MDIVRKALKKSRFISVEQTGRNGKISKENVHDVLIIFTLVE